LTASIKEVADAAVGDTITEDKRPTPSPLEGFKPAQPVVFCGIFPVDAADFEDLRAAMGRLRLNDASFSYEMETSAALGFGFRNASNVNSISTLSRRRLLLSIL